MTEVRCLRCQHWRSDEDNPEAVEREFQMRFGPEVALVGMCGHPEHGGQVNSRWCCKDWTDPADPLECLLQGAAYERLKREDQPWIGPPLARLSRS